MRTILQTTIKGTPVAWARARGGGGHVDGETGAKVGRQRSYFTAPAQKRFKRLVQDEARLAMLTAKARRIHDGKPVPLGTPVVFEALVYLPIPSSFTRAQEAAALAGTLRPTGKPDLDNWLKLPMDGCSGIAYADDAQVVGFGGSGVWYSDAPRLELRIYHADPPGAVNLVVGVTGTPFPVEVDPETFEARVCTGCGSTLSLAYLHHRNPGSLSCCPERKMVPVREALGYGADT